MRFLPFTVLLVGTAIASAQTRVEVYPDDRMMWSDMLLHAENGVVREGRDWRGQVLWTTQPEKIFTGYSTSAFDLAYTVREGQLIQCHSVHCGGTWRRAPSIHWGQLVPLGFSVHGSAPSV